MARSRKENPDRSETQSLRDATARQRVVMIRCPGKTSPDSEVTVTLARDDKAV